MLGLIALIVSSLVVSVPIVLLLHLALIVALVVIAVGVLLAVEVDALCQVAS